jgi:hypothetical protein
MMPGCALGDLDETNFVCDEEDSGVWTALWVLGNGHVCQFG